MKKLILTMLALITTNIFSAEIACVGIEERQRPGGIEMKNDSIYYDNEKIDIELKNPKILKKKYELENIYKADENFKLKKSGDSGYKDKNNEYFLNDNNLYYRRYKVDDNKYYNVEVKGEIRYSTTGHCNNYTRYSDIIKAGDIYIINGNKYSSINDYLSQVYDNEAVEIIYILTDKKLTVNYYFDNGYFTNNFIYNSAKNIFIPDGLQEVRDKNNKLIYKSNFKNGTGYIKIYDKNLNIIKEGKYTNSRKTGDWKIY